MLINFSVENFLSFEKRTEFSMIPSTRVTDKPEHTVKMQDSMEEVSLLKHGVIYGANASGKSNFFKAMDLMKVTIAQQLPIESKKEFCRSKEENKTKPSVFEIQFSLENDCYSYSFSALLAELELKREELYRILPDGTFQCIFKRTAGEMPDFNELPPKDSKDGLKLVTYLDDFDPSQNQLFLTFMNQGKNYENCQHIRYLQDIFQWLLQDIEICRPQASLIKPSYFSKETMEKINQLFPLFDTGIKNIKFTTITKSEFLKEVATVTPFGEAILNEQAREMITQQNPDVVLAVGNKLYKLQIIEKKELEIQSLRLSHLASYGDFTFSEESDGTNRLFELLWLLLSVEENKVYWIDELERSLHPQLTAKLLELFHELHKGKRVQLIFTTHEATIMSLKKFRRDEIWFVEKSKECTSNLYPLDRFTEEYDEELKDAYFEGRYGAIPVFKEII